MTGPSSITEDHNHREHEVLGHLHRLGMLAVLRGYDSQKVLDASLTLIEAGIDIIEVTYTVPGCAEVIAQLKETRPTALIGAGTVTSIDQLEQSVAANADFIVTPGTTPPLLDALASSNVPFLPGVLTPSEVMAALASGAMGVKLFPGSLVGPAGLKALRGPFPDLIVVPTGGVSPQNLSDWRAAGAFAVGAGNDLAPLDAVASGDQQRIRERAHAWLAALASHA